MQSDTEIESVVCQEACISQYFNNSSQQNCSAETQKYQILTGSLNQGEQAMSHTRGEISCDDEQTEEYSLEVDATELTQHSPIEYTDADFESVDGSDYSIEEVDDFSDREHMGECVGKQPNTAHKELSDNSSDETMEKASSRKDEEPKVKKYRQTTLKFGQSREASASTSGTGTRHSGGGSSKGTNRTPGGKIAAGSRDSFFKSRGDKDTENYRLGYPGQRDNLKLNANLRFYKGEVSSFPDGAFIDEMHNDWWGHYELLERHHGYIQWIFPIREEGMNWQAQALQRHEAQAIVEDKEAHRRILLSYEMMLDFYGMRLEDRRTGNLRRSNKWRERYENLNYSSHNFLRITRMLKSLGEFELEHLKKPFLDFILTEIFHRGQLGRTLNSLQNYWIGTIKSDADRLELRRYIEEQTS